MMDAFVDNAEQELQKMFSEIKDDERKENRVHTQMVGLVRFNGSLGRYTVDCLCL